MKKYLTLPNALSASRLAIFPVLLYTAYFEKRPIFAWLFLFSLVSDIADGFLARHYKSVSEFGSKLDSWGDLCNYIAAITGVLLLCRADFMAYYPWFIILFGLYFLGVIMMLFKFKRLIGMHLHSSKITGYVHGFFLISWFLLGFNVYLFYLAMIIGYYSYVEEIILIFILKKPDHDLKSLFWVVKNRLDLWR
ncbi:MAG: CDP-alcohol phosphatidyltransferase family protein [Bacteroidetes bacterium]|nr:CDP-alcohol phosphatidyltransferase family protein [Bacteroidota bacterium]